MPFSDEKTNTKCYVTKKSFQNRFVENYCVSDKSVLVHGLKSDGGHLGACKSFSSSRSRCAIYKHLRLIATVFLFMVVFSLCDSLMLLIVHHVKLPSSSAVWKMKGFKSEKIQKIEYHEHLNTQGGIYQRLLHLASVSLPKDSSILWKEPEDQTSKWQPCADGQQHAHRNLHQQKGQGVKSSGYVLVSANGGLNQQRVAVCNAVVIAALLNASLVLPKFLYSNVWKDISQFGDIYQEEYFVNYLKDVNIVRELPFHLQTLDLEAVGSQITDADIMKEAAPSDFIKIALPHLQRNGVVHFLGFVNRLGFDSLNPNLQRLRCKCNFHALKFVPRIQETASLLVKRIRNHESGLNAMQKLLLGDDVPIDPARQEHVSKGSTKYLALHLRFEIDMVAYSLCDFGGGEKERKELQAYREIHFPRLVEETKNISVSPEVLRKFGKCPLTPEEAALVLSSLGFRSETRGYLAGSDIYGGQSRLRPLKRLFPNLVTKEDLLTSSELAPFKNFSSQMAALDFIACAAADVFAMTDSGSQLSSLVSGYRVYHGGGNAPTLRPNKKRLAKIFSESDSIGWDDFVERVSKMINENQRVHARRRGRSIYRQPRTKGCMCKV